MKSKLLSILFSFLFISNLSALPLLTPSGFGYDYAGFIETNFYESYGFSNPSELIVNFPYVEDFTEFIPDGWSEARGAYGIPDANGTSYFEGRYFANNTGHENGMAARLNIYLDDRREYLISPQFDLSNKTYYLTFDVAMTAYNENEPGDLRDTDDYLALLCNNNDGNGWVELKRWDANNPPDEEGKQEVVTLENYSATAQFAFYGYSAINDSDNDWFIDNFTIDASLPCPEPKDLLVLVTTETTAVLSWEAGTMETDWEYEYGEKGFSLGNGIHGIVNLPTVELSALTEGTEYEVYVRSNCQANSSQWTGVFSWVQTAPLVPDYVEDFNNYLPEGWREARGAYGVPNTSGSSGFTQKQFLNEDSHVNGAAANLNIYKDNENEYLISPVFNLSSQTFYLSFDVALTQYDKSFSGGLVGTDDYLALLVNKFDGNGWTELDRWDANNIPGHLGQQEVFELEDYGTSVQFAFYGYSAIDDYENNDWFIDNFTIEGQPCIQPNNLAIEANSSTTAILSWETGHTENEWEYEYGEKGFSLGNGIHETSNLSSVELSGLIEGTEYELYVRSKCGTINSRWTSLHSWTQTAPIVPDYFEDFSTYLPKGWYEARGVIGYPGTGESSYFRSKQYINDEGHINGLSASFNVFYFRLNEYLLSPVFDLSAQQTYYLSFDLALTRRYSRRAGNLEGADDYLALLCNRNDGNGWVELKRWDEHNPPDYRGQQEVFTLENYGANVQFAFYGYSHVFEYLEHEWFVDNFLISRCAAPKNLVAVPDGQTAVTISWDSGANESEWEYQYRSSSLEIGSATSGSVNTNSISLTGLKGGAHDLYVRSVCGPDSKSNWEKIQWFQNSLPYFEDFNTYLPQGWSEARGAYGEPDTSGSSDFKGAYVDYEGALNEYVANLNFEEDTNEYFISPEFDLSSQTWYLSFDIATEVYENTGMQTDDYMALLFTNNDGNGWVELKRWDANNLPQTTGQHEEFTLENYSATVQFAFYGHSGSEEVPSIDWYIDNFAIDNVLSCAGPKELAATANSETTAVLIWQPGAMETEWEYEYGVKGFSLGNGVHGTANTPRVELSGLIEGTEYDVYVRSNCETNYSRWTDGYSWKQTAPLVPDYTEDFSTYRPEGWFEAQGPIGEPDTRWASRFTSYYYANNWLHENGLAAYLNIYYSGINEYLISPVFDLSTQTYYLSFELAMTEWAEQYPGILAGTDDYMALLYNNHDGNGWVELKRWDANNPPEFKGQLEVFTLEDYGATVQFAFYGYSESIEIADNDWFIDNFSIKDQMPCFSPKELITSVESTTTANVSWEAGNTETEWEYEYGKEGFVLGIGTRGITDQSHVELSGLLDGSLYDVYVRAICGDDYSLWTSASFRTHQVPLVPDYYEDFSTFLPDRWSKAHGYSNDSDRYSSFYSDYFANDVNHVNGSAARLNIYADNIAEYLITPIFDLSARSYQLDFDIALTRWDYNDIGALQGTDDYLALLCNSNDGNGWVELKRWDADNQPDWQGQKEVIPLEGYGNSVQFAFYGHSFFNDAADNDWFIDNFSITNLNDLNTAFIEEEAINVYVTHENILYITGLSGSGTTTISLFNYLGVALFTTELVGNDTNPIQLPSISSGIYVVHVNSDGKQMVKSVFIN